MSAIEEKDRGALRVVINRALMEAIDAENAMHTVMSPYFAPRHPDFQETYVDLRKILEGLVAARKTYLDALLALEKFTSA